MSHGERHLSGRAAWLRAAVLGANDGLLSTASLLTGVAAATTSKGTLITTGLAAMAAGALSMAVGEYSSVSSQRDTELADLDRERSELASEPEAELHELIAIYRRRGLSPALARQVAVELSQGDVLKAHARDELGLDPDDLSRPGQAGFVSALSFAVGALPPVLVVSLLPTTVRVAVTVVVTLVLLALLGAFGAQLGGAPRGRAAVRVLIGGAIAMAVTTVVGRVAGAVV